MIERLFLVMHTCKVKTIFSLQLPLKSGAAVPQSLACLPTSKVITYSNHRGGDFFKKKGLQVPRMMHYKQQIMIIIPHCGEK